MVSRPAVYRYFADRRALLGKTTLFYAGPLARGRDRRELRRHASPAEKAVEAVLFVHAQIARPGARRALGRNLLDAFAIAGITRPTAVVVGVTR
jgi:AcrR family transcriptional regulator